VSASRQVRPLPDSGGIPAGNRKSPVPALSSTGSGRGVSTRIGKYEVEAEVGGSGLVRGFQAWDRATGRRVTLGVLTDVADGQPVERFRREVAALANVRSAGLVAIYELGEHVGMPFAAVEYLGDAHLGQIISGERACTLLEKIRLMCQVAEGAQAAHRGGLNYVGLHPRGIAVCADGAAKVRDFGIVRFTGDTAGEAARYQEAGISLLDVRSDVFAFGVIYYELLTGIDAVAAGGRAALRDKAPDCPELLEQLVLRAMEPDRELRYQSFEDIQFDAEPILREFERRRAAVLIDQARHSMESGELDQAQAAVREALDMDAANPAGERLRIELRGLVQERTSRSRVEALLREAQKETTGGRFARAAELLDLAARLDSGNGAAGQLEQARARLEENRRAAGLLDEVRLALERKDLASAEARVLEALDLDANSAEAIELADAVAEAIRRRELDARIEQEIGRAKSLLLLESFDAALEILTGLEAESPASPVVHQWLAHVREQKDQADRRDRLDAQLEEARALMARQVYAEAAEGLELLRAEFPREPVVSDLLAECWEAAERASTIAEARAQCESLCRGEQFEKALVVVETASRAYPDDAELAGLRLEVEKQRHEFEAAASVRQVLTEAQWLLDQNRVDLAVQFLSEKSAAQPGHPVLAARLAAVEQLQAEWEKRRLVEDCLRRVTALEQAQQWPVALTVLEEALEACPGSMELQQAAARLRGLQREQELQKKLARSIGEVRQLLADGDLEQAEDTLRRALEALPDEPSLQQLREELERDKKFREEWRAAQVLVGRRQFEEAERILVRLDGPGHPEVQTLLKTVREARAAREEEGFYKRGREKALLLIQQKQTEQAADLLRNLLSLFPGDPILERDLQAIGGGPREAKPQPVALPAAPPAAIRRAEPSPAAPPLPPARAVWYRRWPVIAAAGFVLLVSAGAAMTRMWRGGAAPKVSAKPAPAVAVAPAAAPTAMAVAPTVSRSVPVDPAAPVVAPPREPSSAAARVARTAPPVRPFNGATLSSRQAPPKTVAELVPTPPISGTSANWVEPLPVSVTPPLRAPAPPPSPRETPVASPPAPQPRPIGGELQPVKPISIPAPPMPLLAKERGIGGIVNLEATVDKQGAVSKIKVIDGNPLLVPSAVEGVKKWRYQPAVLNGEPIEAEIKIELRFEAARR
jgi:protein TonB